MKIVILIIALIFLNIQLAQSKVTTPNFDFKLSNLDQYLPGSKKQDIDKNNTTGKHQFGGGRGSIWKYQVKHQRYFFEMYIQFQDDVVTDFYVMLPSYFLHDIFHQSLITQFGMQDKFLNENEHSIYVWSKVKGMRIFYEAACTIQCFPIYYSVIGLDIVKTMNGFTPIIEALADRSVIN